MNRHRCVVAVLMGVLIAFTAIPRVVADMTPADEAMVAIRSAESAISDARVAIEKGKDLVMLIPEDSPFLPEVSQMLQTASANWKNALSALKAAKQCSERLASPASASLTHEYALLAKSNAAVALCGAKIVQIGLAYVEAVAYNKTESLDVIKGAMDNALSATSQANLHYGKVKELIAEKHSN